MARYTQSVRHRQNLALDCCESTRSGSTLRNIQRRAGRAGFGADGSGCASGREPGGCEDVAVRTVTDLVDNDVADIRSIGYGDIVRHRATLSARVAGHEVRSGAECSVATLCHRNTRGYNSDGDRKSTRLNSSHGYISYAVFCLKKKKN